MKLANLGEFGLIDRIRRRLLPPGPHLRLGIGDDCAAQVLRPGELLLTTTDLLIEGVHFRREWTGLRQLGRKSVSVNVSDIAAMGGEPRALYLALGIPPDFPLAELDAFTDGFVEAADGYGAALAGGDTCRSPGPLFISVTAEGAVPEGQIVRRSGARPGDGIYVSGTLGDSALALRMLQRGEKPPAFLASRHFDPAARAALGRALAEEGLVTAMIDLSDGVVADLGHILKASGAGARVEASRLPLSEAFRRQADASELLDLALAGGEDYELLFAASGGAEGKLAALASRQGLSLTRIGTVLPAEDGMNVLDFGGTPIPLQRRGFNHFSGAPDETAFP